MHRHWTRTEWSRWSDVTHHRSLLWPWSNRREWRRRSRIQNHSVCSTVPRRILCRKWIMDRAPSPWSSLVRWWRRRMCRMCRMCSRCWRSHPQRDRVNICRCTRNIHKMCSNTLSHRDRLHYRSTNLRSNRSHSIYRHHSTNTNTINSSSSHRSSTW